MSQDKDRIADALAALSAGGGERDERDPHAATPAAPALPPAPVARVRATTPSRAPAAPSGRPARPAAPAPSAASIPSASTRHRQRAPVHATLGFRQTLIPICLSMGVGLLLAMLGWFMLDPDHPARGVGTWAPITIGIVGAAMLALGIANMLSVRKLLALRAD